MVGIAATALAALLCATPGPPECAACDSNVVVGGHQVSEFTRFVTVRRTDVAPSESPMPCMQSLVSALTNQSGHSAFPSLAKIPLDSAEGAVLGRCLRQAMVDSARVLGLPSESLALCVSPSQTPELTAIPIAAYLAGTDTSLVWIVVARRAGWKGDKRIVLACRARDGKVLCVNDSW